MERYQIFIKRLNYIFFLVLMATLPLPRKFSHVMLIVWAVSWLLELRFIKKENFCGWKALFPGLGLAVWVLWECVSLLWGGEQAHFRDCHVSLLILPFILAFGVNEQYQWKQAAKVLIISSLLSGLLYGFTLYWVLNHSVILEYHYQGPIYPLQVYHCEMLLSFIKHRLFYCTLLVIDIILLWMLREDCWKRWGRIEGTVYLALGIGICLFIIIITGSRASLYTLLILAAVYGIRLIPKKKGGWVLGIVIGIIAIGLAIWQYHPRMKTITIDQIMHPNNYINELSYQNPRVLTWYYALQNPEDYLAHGMGVCQSESYLIDSYEQADWEMGVQEHFHAHNQYLLVCMELGIMAMILFIAYWIYLPLCYPKKTRQRDFALYLALIFGLNMLTDCLFSSMEGVVYICALLLLTGILPNAKKECESVSSVCPSDRLSGSDNIVAVDD